MCVCMIFAQSLSKIDKQIIQHTFDAEFGISERLIHEQIKEHPTSPKYQFYLFAKDIGAVAHKMYEIPNDLRKGYRDSVYHVIFERAEMFLDTIDEDKLSIDDKFYVGAIYGFIGRSIANESLFKAFKYGKRGRNYLQEVVEENPEYYDAYLGLGMFNYYADRLGGFIGFISSILGFSGDRELGLKQIKMAAEKGTQSFAEANLVLGEIYWNMEQQPEFAYSYFKAFVERYPKNKVMLNVYAQLLVRLNKYEEFKTLIAQRNNDLNHFSMARFYFETGEFPNAYHAFSLVTKNPNQYKFWQVRQSYFRLALIHALNKETEDIKPFIPHLDDNLKQWLTTSMKDPVLKHIYDLRSVVNTGTADSLIAQCSKTPHSYITKNLEELHLLYYARYLASTKQYDILKDVLNREFKEYIFDLHLEKLKLYECVQPTEDELETLVDQLEEYELDPLVFRAEDLQKKYGYN